MKWINLITSIFLLLHSSCGERKENREVHHLIKPKMANALEMQMATIENNPNWKVMNSLSYNNNAGSTEEVIAYLNARDEAVKLEEHYSDASTGNYGTRVFYVSKQKTFASKELYFDQSLDLHKFIERITFYDEHQNPIFSRERKAETEIDLESQNFQNVKPKSVSIDRAMKVINQQGEFSTTFQGFIQSNGVTYILVGENSKNGYASSLVIQNENEDIKKLKLNERGMIGTPLQISHQTVVDEKGLKFQILLHLVINS